MIQWDFLWSGLGDEVQFPLVNWKTVCKPIPWGGLGIKCPAILNQALLGKWFWCFATKHDILQKQVVVTRYGQDAGSWVSGVVQVSMVCLCGNIFDMVGSSSFLTLSSKWVRVRLSVFCWIFGVGRMLLAWLFHCYSAQLGVKMPWWLITCVDRMGFLIGMFDLLGCCMIGNQSLSRSLLIYYISNRFTKIERIGCVGILQGVVFLRRNLITRFSLRVPLQFFPGKVFGRLGFRLELHSLCGRLLMGRFSQWIIYRSVVIVLQNGVVCARLVENLPNIYFSIVGSHKAFGRWYFVYLGQFGSCLNRWSTSWPIGWVFS